MRKGFKIAIIVVGVLFLAGVGFAYYVYDSIRDTANAIHEPIDGRQMPTRDVSIEDSEPVSFLIAGIDATGDDLSGRSDTMILVTVNPAMNSLKMLSIPRDTRTEIVGRGTVEKINHAYAYGGPAMAMDSVENLFDVSIDHYVSINMEGFKELIDALGGVTVDNDFEFSLDGYSFPEGRQFLSGEEALAYTRMRKEDPRGDFGRAARQREIVEAVIKEAAQFSSITKANEMLDVVGGSVRTDMSLDQMWTLQNNYRGSLGTVDQLEFDYTTPTIDNVSYVVLSDETVAEISAELREHLELD
ncbi:LCP family glycopolymer transferase [Alkalicoccobacillus murimartini]|uniref:LCP family protein required for cell wall assembly n=1 Tax=Alkalicoccobacillus murimartini TaxID=171685 RepID=A0ABT9YHL1_9BACI|nr:LCP family protein [Alkalicoccobacillus murimartini]MDQ0207001.1 LCP family protein required for cell wall assembly [Alkalicoccobacillus murimartini]